MSRHFIIKVIRQFTKTPNQALISKYNQKFKQIQEVEFEKRKLKVVAGQSLKNVELNELTKSIPNSPSAFAIENFKESTKLVKQKRNSEY